jgi:hypothetical protein
MFMGAIIMAALPPCEVPGFLHHRSHANLAPFVPFVVDAGRAVGGGGFLLAGTTPATG